MIKRRTEAFAAIDKCIPKLVTKLLGEDLKIGLNSLLKILQNPLYNKQVVLALQILNDYNVFFVLANV